MEGSTKSNKNLILAAAAVILILVIAAGGFFVLNNRENLPIENLESENSPKQTSQQFNPTSGQNSNNGMMMSIHMTATYKDGTYSATGSYATPGGMEQLGVSVTLKNGVITSSSVTQEGKSPTAKVKQADFAQNFRSFVIGKNIDQVNLTVVSGSSLTTQGFDDALTQIKSQAKS